MKAFLFLKITFGKIAMKKKYLIINTILFFSVVLLYACSNGKATDKNNNNDTIAALLGKDITIPGNFSNQTALVFDSSQLASFVKKYPQLKPVQGNLDSFYRKRKFAFAWYDGNGLIEQAANLYNRIQNLNEEGLPDSLPYKEQFANLLNNDGLDSASHPSVYTEIMLTAQYFLYAHKVWGGIDQKKVTAMDWYLPRKKASYNQLLDSLIGGKNILDTAPVYRQYALLKDQLKKYREILSAGGFPQIITDKKTYKKGDSSAVIDSIRKALFLTGDLSNNNNSNMFDDELELGIKNFQLRIGDQQDGAAGPFVLRELKVPVEKRIQQLIVNMERSRWVPVNITGNYVVINIPEYRLHVYENDSLAWSMKVVVGTAAHKTVIFNGNIKYIVFSPYWNVPNSILQKEVLPAIKRNPNYLATHNMEWSGNSVRQKPGPKNSLGLVKFLFPNSHDIYLHDTPSKSLFGESTRAFSHGCIRISEPQRFAEYLLRKDSSWNTQKIVEAMNSGKEKYVTLKDPVPVFIAYFTAWVDRQGKLNFRNDVYGRDARLAEMMLEKPSL